MRRRRLRAIYRVRTSEHPGDHAGRLGGKVRRFNLQPLPEELERVAAHGPSEPGMCDFGRTVPTPRASFGVHPPLPDRRTLPADNGRGIPASPSRPLR